MANRNHFVIRNDFAKLLVLNIEPEGAFFPLEKGEEVSVTDEFRNNPVTVTLTDSDRGPILSIWPGDGDVCVKKDGIDVLELIEKRVRA